MEPAALESRDEALVEEARRVLDRVYRPDRYTVAAALRGRSGRAYVAVNVESFHGPCAEPVALGAAIAAGETAFDVIVAVGRRGVLPPCGNCRQILLHHVPAVWVILPRDGVLSKVRVDDLLPHVEGLL